MRFLLRVFALYRPSLCYWRTVPWKNLLRLGLHWLLPNSCLWCDLPVQQATAQLCNYCQRQLPRLTLAAHHYNAFLLPGIARGIKSARFDQLYSLSWYQQPWQHWISQWKFRQDYACGDALGQQWQLAFLILRDQAHFQFDAVCYVPMHPSRQRRRGFNQALQLAQMAANILQLPLVHIFKAQYDLPHQVGLSRQQRRANLRRQFQLLPGKLPARMLLIDDVITTAATVNQLSRLLKKAAVSWVGVATLAITASPGINLELYQTLGGD